MILALIGSIWTLLIVGLGFVFGYRMGQHSETDVLHEMHQAIKRKKRDTTGAIRPTPKLQREREKNKSLQDFVDDL